MTGAAAPNRLREEREKRELELYDVAHLVRKDPSTISRYERGESPVPEGVYRTLAVEWDLSVDHLMGLDGFTPPDIGLGDPNEAAA